MVLAVTVVSFLADSSIERAAPGTGQAAEMAADRKKSSYAKLLPSHISQPITVDNLGAFSSSTMEFMKPERPWS